MPLLTANGTLTGAFSDLNATFPGQQPCERSVVQPVQTGSSLLLSVTVDTTRCSLLPLGAIIGIAIGGAALLGVAIHCYRRYQVNQYTAQAKADIKMRTCTLDDMKRQH